MNSKSLFDQDVFDQSLERINKLTSDTKPDWGKMDTAQMLAHCAEVIDVSNGKPLKNTPWLVKLLKGMIKKMVIGPTPYPRSTRTHPQYLQNSPKDFQAEKKHLLESLTKLKELEDSDVPHPLFGNLTKQEKGWAMYKHLDHHLTQFGV